MEPAGALEFAARRGSVDVLEALARDEPGLPDVPRADRERRALEDVAVLRDEDVPGRRPVDAALVGLGVPCERLAETWSPTSGGPVPDDAERVRDRERIGAHRRVALHRRIAVLRNQPSLFVDLHC